MGIESFMNTDGTITYDIDNSTVSVKVRFVRQRKIVRNALGEENVVVPMVYMMPPTTTPNTADTITIDGTVYSILSIAEPRDGSGNVHHLELELGD